MYQWLENKLSRLLAMSNKSHKSTLHQEKIRNSRNWKCDCGMDTNELIIWSLDKLIGSYN